LGAGLGVGITVFGVGTGIGPLVAAALKPVHVNLNPQKMLVQQ